RIYHYLEDTVAGRREDQLCRHDRQRHGRTGAARVDYRGSDQEPVPAARPNLRPQRQAGGAFVPHCVLPRSVSRIFSDTGLAPCPINRNSRGSCMPEQPTARKILEQEEERPDLKIDLQEEPGNLLEKPVSAAENYLRRKAEVTQQDYEEFLQY